MKKNSKTKILLSLITVAIMLITLTTPAMADDFIDLDITEKESSTLDEEFTEFDDSGNASKEEIKTDDVKASSEKQQDVPSSTESASEKTKSEGKSAKPDGISRRSAEPIIELSGQEILILGENGRYIVKYQQASTATAVLPKISPGDWSDDPNDWDQGAWTKVLRAGKYDANSVILLNDGTRDESPYYFGINIYAIPTASTKTNPIVLKQIKMKPNSIKGTAIHLLPGTHIKIVHDGTNGAAIDLSEIPSNPHTASASSINSVKLISGVGTPESSLVVQTTEQAVNTHGSFTVSTGNSASIETTQSSAKPSMMVRGTGIQGAFSLKSNSTSYGIYDEGSMTIYPGAFEVSVSVAGGTAYSGLINFDTSTTGGVNITNTGSGRGIELRGKVGNASRIINNAIGSTMNVSVAGTGVGIFANLNGSVQSNGATINVNVGDGVGIYTDSNISTFSSPSADSIITAKADKGIGAITAYLDTRKGILDFSSLGATSQDLVALIPDLAGRTIAQSAGLMYFGGYGSNITQGSTLKVSAPKELDGSYGMLAAPSAADTKAYSAPFISVDATSGAEATGNIGIDGSSFRFQGKLAVDGKKHAIIAEVLILIDTELAGALVGEESGIKFRNQDPATISSNYDPQSLSFTIRNTAGNTDIIKVEGGKYGIEGINTVFDNDTDYRNITIATTNANLEVTSTEAGSTGIFFNDASATPGQTLEANFIRSNIKVNGVKDGMRLENFDLVKFDGGANKVSFTGTGDEVGIYMSATKTITSAGSYEIHGTSRETPPDEIGKTPAVYFGNKPSSITLTSTSTTFTNITEEYKTKALEPILAGSSYLQYAPDRNIPIGNGIWNDAASWTSTETRYNITTSAAGLTTTECKENALIIGNMRGSDVGAVISFDETKAQYEIITRGDLNSIVVTFDTDGGAPVPTFQVLFIGEKVIIPTEPTKLGHTFSHWQEEGQTGAFDFDTALSSIGDKNLIAQWTELEYNVTFVKNIKATITVDDTSWPPTQVVKYGKLVTKPASPTTITAHNVVTFSHWSTDAAGLNTFDFTTTAITADVVLYANWNIPKITVEFVTFGETGPALADQTVEFLDKATKPADPAKTGHTFSGWSKTDGGTDYWNFNDPVKTNTTLYAKWEPITYTVTLNGNGGTPATATESVKYGELVVVATEPTQVGHTFDRWTTDKAGINDWNLSSDVVEGNMTLYAQWTVNSYDVNFHMDGGTPVIPTASVKYNQKIVKPADPTKTGFKFLGWTSDVAGKTPWNFNTLMPAKDVDLYAQWERLGFVVTYDSKGGEPAKQEKNFQYDELITTPGKEPTRRLYKFLGWFMDEAFTTPVNFGTDKMPSNNITVYGKWERTHYEVFFDVNGGDKATEPKTLAVEIGKTADISSFQPGGKKAPVYKGNFLLGWTDGAGNKVVANFNMPTSDVHLKANWVSSDSLVNYTGPNSIVDYKDEITEKEISDQLTTEAKYTDYLGNTVSINVVKEWDKSIISRGGVEQVKLYIVDSAGQKIGVNIDVHVYILNRAYITARDTVIFNQGDRVSVDGNEWSAKAFKELPDLVAKTIKRIPLKVSYDSNGLTTEIMGDYYPVFTSDDIDYFGEKISLTKTVTAIVLIGIDKEEINQISDESKFWVEVSKTLHLSLKKEVWHLDGKSYKAGPSKFDNLKNTKEYDRKVIADPMSYLDMSAEALQVLKEQDNSRLEVKMNILTWYFDSEDFKDSKTDPTGFYPLDVDNYTTNKDLIKAGKNGNSMQLHFEMNKYWQGWATLEVDLNQNLLASGKKGNSIYMFHYNEDTRELELIGKMKASGEKRYSIKLNGVFKDYIIMDHLPGGKPSTGATTKVSGGLVSGKQVDTPISYRITDLTNPLDSETKDDINRNLHSSGKTIDQITLVTQLEVEDVGNNKLPIIIGSSLIALAGAGALTLYFFKKRKDDEYNDYDEDYDY